MPKRKSAPSYPRFKVVIGDTHSGCRMALVPRGGVTLDGGGRYMPSPFQLKLHDMWDEFFEWVDEKTEGEPWDLIHTGDAIDGVHHGSTTQISHNMEDQRDIAIAVLAPVVARCRKSGGRYYHIRGTEAHVGQSGCDEEAVAKHLEAVPNAEGQCSRFEMWMDLQGSLIHFMHHIGTVSSNAYEATPVNKELMEMYTEAARWGQRPPDMICRAHRHRMLQIQVPTAQGRGWAVVGPAWQGKTPFAFKVAGARVSTPQFGGYIITKEHGFLYTLEKTWTISRSKVEV